MLPQASSRRASRRRSSPKRDCPEDDKVFIAGFQRKNRERVYNSIYGGDFVIPAKKPYVSVGAHERCVNRQGGPLVNAAALVLQNEGANKGLSIAEIVKDMAGYYEREMSADELYSRYIADKGAQISALRTSPRRASPRRSPARRASPSRFQANEERLPSPRRADFERRTAGF